MKKLALLSMILLCAMTVVVGERRIEIVSYRLDMRLDSAGRLLNVQALIKLAKDDSIKAVRLNFADIIPIHEATCNGDTIGYRRSQDGLLLQLPAFRKGELRFNYTLETDSFKSDRVIALVRARKWFPYLYDNVASSEINLTVPAGYYAYSSGKQSGYEFDGTNRQYHFRVKVNAGMPLFIAPVDYYTGQTQQWKGRKLNYVFHTTDTAKANTVVRESLQVFRFANKFIGKYKPTTFTFIEFPGFDFCQSMPGFVLMGPEYIADVNKPDKRYWVGHETFHQWVGNGYFTRLYNHSSYTRFTEESLTEYLRMVYLQKSFGDDTLKAMLRENCRIYNTYIKDTAEDLPIAANRPNWVTYTLGPVIWHVVRGEMGDKKWQKFIRKLYSKYYGKVIDYAVFREQLVKFASEETVIRMEKCLNEKGIPVEFAE
jgi:hypothetical protein